MDRILARVRLDPAWAAKSRVKMWPDFGSTAAPFPPTPVISPAESALSRLEIVNRSGSASTADVFFVSATARVALGAGYTIGIQQHRERPLTEVSHRETHLPKSPFRCARSERALVKPERPE